MSSPTKVYQDGDPRHATEGGCWFCGRVDSSLTLLFDFEFDTYVHKECLHTELMVDPDHPEAKFMAYLLEEKVH